MNMENKKNSSTKNEKALIMGVTLLSMIVIIGIGYAFFSSTVSNTNHEEVSAETATIALKFDDNDNGIGGTLNLGESITKKFTLENTGTGDAYAKINWVSLINTYMQGSLSYTLEQSTSENGTYERLGSGNVPISNAQTTTTLKNGILIPVNTMYYYKLTITLNNLENINQNSDINATFSSYFGLEEGNLSGADTIQNLVAGEQANTTDVITKTAPAGSTCTNTLAYDGTVDNNLRYVGANPCNYVTFNGESPSAVTVYRIMSKAEGYDAWGQSFQTVEACNSVYTSEYSWDTDNEFECQERHETVGGWRIVGVMNNVDDGTGNLETRIKLIRGGSLGSYSWDTSSSEVNSGLGVNDWTQADLMYELNGDYLNTNLEANTYWYNGRNNQKTAEFDYTKRLSISAQELIGDAKWNLGGFEYKDETLIPNTMYTNERGTTVWGSTSEQECSDGACPRSTEWTGKVALMYPSDYGFATAGGQTTARSVCIGILSIYGALSGEKWYNDNYSDCKQNDWLNLSSNWNWFLSTYSNDSRSAYGLYVSGYYSYNSTYAGFFDVLPTVYLKSGVTITDGNGTESDPYVFGIK